MNDTQFSHPTASRRGFLGVAGSALAGSALPAAADESPAVAGLPAGGVHAAGREVIH